MDIIGRGFLAGSLTALAASHPRVTVLAAGVSTTAVDTAAAFRQERDLVMATAESCRRSGRLLVFLSTASHALYGATTTPADESVPLAPDTAYGRHKLSLEESVRASGAPWLILRLSHVVGRGQRPHQLLPTLVRQVAAGTVTVYRGAHRDLVDVRDVVRAVDGLLARGVRDETVNIASGTPYAIEDIVAGVERRLGTRAVRQMVDGYAVRSLVSVERLRLLVPDACPPGGLPYLDGLLDRYVHAEDTALLRE
ncbi:NAD-dependent epimerase/dehydratase family protein [Streptomyces capitiformicae]|uniref:NAD-dependent epimerase n=1 Tax=Streptomyces capitiformicae TaxID=2014920 RepID=A0A919DHP5_9ACTN|nr:NAD-dependent epimerase/dehydratase family protein [Streptomyces capitiformicae]GHE48416.1 NAD-dependent epimerase [Streptomyces capitiformicae]